MNMSGSSRNYQSLHMNFATASSQLPSHLYTSSVAPRVTQDLCVTDHFYPSSIRQIPPFLNDSGITSGLLTFHLRNL